MKLPQLKEAKDKGKQSASVDCVGQLVQEELVTLPVALQLYSTKRMENRYRLHKAVVGAVVTILQPMPPQNYSASWQRLGASWPDWYHLSLPLHA